MKHFANFGYVKAANKQLKRLQEMKSGLPTPMGKISEAASNSELRGVRAGEAKRYLESKIQGARHSRASVSNKNDLSFPYKKEDVPDSRKLEGWSESRRTLDSTAAPNGYLGYQKDPYKGYGGMMEEPIPMEDLSRAPLRKALVPTYKEANQYGRYNAIARDYE